MSNYIQFELFLIIPINCPSTTLTEYIINLIKAIEFKQFKSRNLFNSSLVYLLSTYINMDFVYFEIEQFNHKNRCGYFVNYMFCIKIIHFDTHGS